MGLLDSSVVELGGKEFRDFSSGTETFHCGLTGGRGAERGSKRAPWNSQSPAG